MSKTILEAAEERGAVRTTRLLLRAMLEKYVGPIPKEIQHLIDAEDDVERLSAAVLQAAQLKSYADFRQAF